MNKYKARLSRDKPGSERANEVKAPDIFQRLSFRTRSGPDTLIHNQRSFLKNILLMHQAIFELHEQRAPTVPFVQLILRRQHW